MAQTLGYFTALVITEANNQRRRRVPAAPLQGVIGEAPPLKHDPGKIPGTQTTLSPNPGKKCGFTPRRMVQRGEIPHFFFSENWRQHGLAARDLREQSHFKFGEINRLGSGGGTKPVIFFWQKF